jgi:hypothetical protein
MVNVGSLSASPAEQLRCCGSSSAWFDLTCDIPDKTREFARDRYANFVERQLARREFAVTLREAQLRPPGDLAHHLGLTLLARFERPADARGKAIVPGRFDENAARMAVAGLGDAAGDGCRWCAQWG